MKTSARIIGTALAVAAALTSSAGAEGGDVVRSRAHERPIKTGHDRCRETPVFVYCGDHWRWSQVPVTFRVNVAEGPSGAWGAIEEAARSWNLAWSGVAPASTTLPIPCSAICLVSDGGARGGQNGVNEIVFGNPVGCQPASTSWIAVACPWRADPNASKLNFHRMVEVDIFFKPGHWRVPDAAELVVGEASSYYPPFPCTRVYPTPWYDLQSGATHEFGHALGLDDLSGYWPGDVTAVGFSQAMYGSYFPCSTNKRRLGAGDIAALSLAKQASYDDR